MRRVANRVLSIWHALRSGRTLDRAMDDEMRFHVEMEADRLVRERGLDPGEARRQALLAFGGFEKFKEQGRDTRGLRWLDVLSIDARLGLRMLVKYRGLTVVGGFAMAVAIGIGATCFEVFSQVLDPVLPVEDGDRVVAIHYATSTPGSAERRILHDFVEWRQQIKSIEQLGAYRTASHNLLSGSGPHEPIVVAEITASGFAVASTAPTHGRYLVPDDEREGAPPVIVIGHQAWQSRFSGDPSIVGRSINLSGVLTTVVGVMPEGFRFPLDHQYWIPLRLNPQAYERMQGPRLFVFGRLAAGVSIEAAQAELTTIGQRTAADRAKTHQHLRLVALPYTHEHLGLSSPLRRWTIRILVMFLGALTFVMGLGGILGRTANKVVLDNASGGDRGPNLSTAEEDARHRKNFLVGGQLAFSGFIIAGILLPAGIALRVVGEVRERRALGATAKTKTRAKLDIDASGLTVRL